MCVELYIFFYILEIIKSFEVKSGYVHINFKCHWRSIGVIWVVLHFFTGATVVDESFEGP